MFPVSEQKIRYKSLAEAWHRFEKLVEASWIKPFLLENVSEKILEHSQTAAERD